MTDIIKIVDVETTGIAPPEHSVVEIASLDMVDGQIVGSRHFLVAPGRGIPCEASAVHHLVDADVVGAPSLDQVAQAALMRPRPIVLVAHSARFERQWLDQYTGGISWICTMKAAMRVWPQSPGFSNQLLRYWLGLGDLGPDAYPTHRALPDCIVTANILKRLLESATVLDMIAWTREPPLLPRIPFGKHRGKPWSDIPMDYFDWALRQDDMDDDIKWNMRQEIARRFETREDYLANSITLVNTLSSVQELNDWFISERPNRELYKISSNAVEFSQLVAACADRKRTLLTKEDNHVDQ